MDKIKGIIEAILFATGRPVEVHELELALEKSPAEIKDIIKSMNDDYKNNDSRGINIVSFDNKFQLSTKMDLHDYVLMVVDKRNKPKISNAALETLAIIAYNPRITRPEIEAIRGVNVDGTMYKLMEYGLVEEAGKLDLPGKPMGYRTTDLFLKLFGYKTLKDLPELPKYKLDSNKQIVIDELIEEDSIEKIDVKENNAEENKIND